MNFVTAEYTDDVVDRRAKEVSNFLDMLRSASVGHDEAKRSEAHEDWKVCYLVLGVKPQIRTTENQHTGIC